MTLDTICTAVTIKPVGEAIFHEGATMVEMEDESGGAFIIVSQPSRETTYNRHNAVCFDLDEWPAIRKEIDRMVAAAHKYNQQVN